MAVVLIVEDEELIRQSAEWTIADLGHKTLAASDLAEALAHLRSDRPIDLLFVDIRLDRIALGGYEVANQAVTFWPGLRVLYTSGTPFCGDMAARFVRGGQFIQKPCFPDQLAVSVEDLLRRSNDTFGPAAPGSETP
jgi:CheY-like chemotaxis protein